RGRKMKVHYVDSFLTDCDAEYGDYLLSEGKELLRNESREKGMPKWVKTNLPFKMTEEAMFNRCLNFLKSIGVSDEESAADFIGFYGTDCVVNLENRVHGHKMPFKSQDGAYLNLSSWLKQ